MLFLYKKISGGIFKKGTYYKIATAVVAVILVFWVVYAVKTKAEVASFHPTSCLGSFINPQNAQGKPEVSLENPNSEQFNEENSAFYDGGLKEIYCGGFQGDLPEGKIKKINLKFSLLVTDKKTESPVAAGTTVSSPETASILDKILDIIPSRNVEIVVSTVGSDTTSTPQTITVVNSIENSSSTDSSFESAPSQEIIPQLPQEQTPPPQEEIPSLPPSSFLNFFRIALAQETESSTILSSSSENISENIFSGSSSSPIVDSSSTTSTITASTTATSTGAISDYFLRVFYTLDGVNWQLLGTVNKDNWQNLSFEIPVSSWQDLSKIQIKIDSLAAVDNPPYVYLDGVVLEAEYEKPSENNPIGEISTSTSADISQNLSNALGSLSFSSSTFAPQDISAQELQQESQENQTENNQDGATTTENIDNFSELVSALPIKYFQPRAVKDIALDFDAKHSCRINPTDISIKENGTAIGKIYFKKTDPGKIYRVEIGNLPYGIEINLDMATNSIVEARELKIDEDSIDFSIYSYIGSQKGSFNIPIIFSENKGIGNPSNSFCQFNLTSE